MWWPTCLRHVDGSLWMVIMLVPRSGEKGPSSWFTPLTFSSSRDQRMAPVALACEVQATVGSVAGPGNIGWSKSSPESGGKRCNARCSILRSHPSSHDVRILDLCSSLAISMQNSMEGCPLLDANSVTTHVYVGGSVWKKLTNIFSHGLKLPTRW